MKINKELLDVVDYQLILSECFEYSSVQSECLEHPIIKRFGSPNRSIYINPNTIEIRGIDYEKPLILPIYNADLEKIQCAVLNDKKRVEFIDGHIAKGFCYFGDLHKDQPIIITSSLEAFFKIEQTGYAVILVVLPKLCLNNVLELTNFDFEQIEFVLKQLRKAGYKDLYLPTRCEQIGWESFRKLEQNTGVKLLNQSLKIDKNEDFVELNQDESVSHLTKFLDQSISLMSQKNVLPKGHSAEPFLYGDGVYHSLDDGLFYIENMKAEKNKRYISSPIRVLAQTRDMTNNAWGRLIEWYDPDGVRHTQAVPMELFQADGAELRKALAYQGVTIASDGKSRHLLQAYLMSFPTNKRVLCVDRVGWQDNVFIL